ncbi:efflux RND transporter periplasmic adaptor subunit [Solitalea canadensis]|uniref:RND family efflux transporter, MFP subunit n=1 Tax=Solitalea canadensis (strain ATCC 29591 / DSM 3403 / JCM 21819 / LMG 8368 / NBRC 15130 / NCIMB 12057 / USAM 9D) TaxID=929556 RepID=H8KN52_SOLCM|nr:efflux RND transporter periplasmic adaptor subunit [Solitalea canadensis]AFD09385.1 RND family efflux transporter, MFP subunit [Solitalea canadensis DSM 3403]
MHLIRNCFHPVLIGSGMMILLFVGCSNDQPKAIKEEKFIVTDTLLSSLLIDTVKSSNSTSEITLTGKIVPDEDKMVKIYPMVSGLVQDVHVHSGDVVGKGQLLATMRSAEVAGYAKEAISSEAELKTSLREMQVTEDLYNSGMASQRDLEVAKANYEKAKAEDRRSKAVLHINPSKGDLNYMVKSPISGFVIEKKVTNNMQVRTDNAENMFAIADLSSMWALVNVYESDISKVKAGDNVKITTLSYPDKVFSGKIDKVYNTIDPENKVVKARVKINNPDLILKPEMFANVEISSVGDDTMPVIDTQCLIFDNNQYYVLVIEGKEKVKIKPVTIARKTENKAYIRSGVKSGDHLIASRQVFIYESLK